MTAATGGSGAGGLVPERHPTGDFFVCDIFDALPKGDLATMEHPVFSLSTRPDRRILSYLHNGAEITVTPSVRGLATIHDKDILIYCISQLVAALNAGRTVARQLTLRAHDLLVATNRETVIDLLAQGLRQELSELLPEDQIVSARFGATLGTYIGPGAVGLALTRAG